MPLKIGICMGMGNAPKNGLVEDAQRLDVITQLSVSLCNHKVISGGNVIRNPTPRLARVIHDVCSFLVGSVPRENHMLLYTNQAGEAGRCL